MLIGRQLVTWRAICTDIAWRAICSNVYQGRHLASMVQLRAYVHKNISDSADVVLKQTDSVTFCTTKMLQAKVPLLSYNIRHFALWFVQFDFFQ